MLTRCLKPEGDAQRLWALKVLAADPGLARPVNLLLEGGLMGSRTGCRTREAALAVARAIKAAAPWVSQDNDCTATAAAAPASEYPIRRPP